MILNRRSFLKLAGAATASGLIIPAWVPPREPYVRVGQVVDYIGPHPGGFIGGEIVRAVGEWDRIGYPVTLMLNTYPRQPRPERIYDFDLCVFREEVPDDFWRHEVNQRLYNNIHTYVRTKRFGESISEAVAKLNFVASR